MQNKVIVVVLWILSVAISYGAGWFKGVASAPRIAAESAAVLGYTGLFFVVAIVIVGAYFFLTRTRSTPGAAPAPNPTGFGSAGR